MIVDMILECLHFHKVLVLVAHLASHIEYDLCMVMMCLQSLNYYLLCQLVLFLWLLLMQWKLLLLSSQSLLKYLHKYRKLLDRLLEYCSVYIVVELHLQKVPHTIYDLDKLSLSLLFGLSWFCLMSEKMFASEKKCLFSL